MNFMFDQPCGNFLTPKMSALGSNLSQHKAGSYRDYSISISPSFARAVQSKPTLSQLAG